MLVDLLLTLLVLLILVSWAFWILTILLAYMFLDRQTDPQPGFMPPAAILIPIKGLDAGLYHNLASFCSQDYPDYEVLIGVEDRRDACLSIVHQVRREFTTCRMKVCIAQPRGANRKAAMLHYLAGQTSQAILVAVDSDMRATPDYLSRVVSPLAEPRIGMVTCLYQGIEPLNLTARLEALHMSASFLPLVLVARQFLRMRFALGATLVLRRADLERLGGFAAVSAYLADDYQLGKRISSLGLRVHLSHYIIAASLGSPSIRVYWERQVRLARTNRVCRPVEYPFQLIYFSLVLSIILVFASRFSRPALLLLFASLLLRWSVAWAISTWTDNHALRRWMILLPVQDLLSALVWALGLAGSQVVWRGERYQILEDGRLAPEEAPATHSLGTGS